MYIAWCVYVMRTFIVVSFTNYFLCRVYFRGVAQIVDLLMKQQSRMIVYSNFCLCYRLFISFTFV